MRGTLGCRRDLGGALVTWDPCRGGSPDDRALDGVQFVTLCDDVGDDDGDVVLASGTVCGVDEAGQGFVGIWPCQQALDGFVVDETTQPVGAEQQPVTQTHVDQTGVWGVLGLSVEHLEQQRTVRVHRSLLRGDATLVDEGLHPGVVVGETTQLAVAQQVGT